MRKTISGLIAAFAVIAAGGATPANACDSCSPCGYVSPCGTAYVQPYATYERLPNPEVQYRSAPIAQPQYYYVEQGPTYTGPGDIAPRRFYQEQGVSGWGYRRHHHHHGYHHHWHQYGYHHQPHVLHSYY
jgi:hypothetical protein